MVSTEVGESFSAEQIEELIDGAVKIGTNGFSHTSKGCSNYQKVNKQDAQVCVVARAEDNVDVVL